MTSSLERTFLYYLRVCDPAGVIPEPTPEYRFHSVRKWRFDFAIVEYKLAIECEGGVYSNGRHTRSQGFIEDCRKYTAAALDGWAVMRITSVDLDSDPCAVIDSIREFITREAYVHSS